MGACQCFSRSQEEKTELQLNKKKPDPKNYLKNIIKIQSFIRGYQVRKKYFNLCLKNYNNRVIDNLHKYAQTCHMKRDRKLPPFIYDYEKDNEDPHFEERQFRPVLPIPNGGFYKGEWYKQLSEAFRIFIFSVLSVGLRIKGTAVVCKSGQMVLSMRAIGEIIKQIYLEDCCMLMEMFMKAAG